MEVVSQTIHEIDDNERCPKCGGKVIVISNFNDGAWMVVCQNCQATPGSAPSKRQAKLNWKLFAEEVSRNGQG